MYDNMVIVFQVLTIDTPQLACEDEFKINILECARVSTPKKISSEIK